MLAHVTRKTARLLLTARAPGAAAAAWDAVRLASTEAPPTEAATPAVATEAKAKKLRQPRKPKAKSVLFADDAAAPEAEAKAESAVTEQPTEANQTAAATPAPRRKKKTFSFSNAQKEPEPELEVFDYPAYWAEDFPKEFDNDMKHEVEKLQIFSDFTMLMDDSWQKEIHPLFDGADIELAFNVPLEDFDERLFVDDKTTYDTKVVMEVPLSCFAGLSKDGLEIVKKLAGPRYNANKKHLKLTEDRYPTRVFNHKRLCDILHDLTETAHKLSAETKQANSA